MKWQFNALQPFEIRNISVVLRLDSSTALGTLLHNAAYIYPIVSDTTSANNISEVTETVIGAFDPNEKIVSPENPIDVGETLTYTVFFQNTGTYHAVNVVLRDTLDSRFDLSTFKVIGYSHPMNYKIKANGIVEFNYPDIYLPDSNANEPKSHGFVKYSVKLKDDVQIGENVQNTAFIYFDYNEAVVTNTTNSFLGVTSVTKIGDETQLEVYPNPSSGELFVKINEIDVVGEVVLANTLGQELLSKVVTSEITELSLEDLSSGVYMLYLRKGNNILGRTKLLVKQ